MTYLYSQGRPRGVKADVPCNGAILPNGSHDRCYDEASVAYLLRAANGATIAVKVCDDHDVIPAGFTVDKRTVICRVPRLEVVN